MLHAVIFTLTIITTTINGFHLQLLSPDPHIGFVNELDECFGPENADQHRWWCQNIGKDLSRFKVKKEETSLTPQLSTAGTAQSIPNIAPEKGMMSKLKARGKAFVAPKWKALDILGPKGFNRVVAAIADYTQVLKALDKTPPLVAGYTREASTQLTPAIVPMDVYRLLRMYHHEPNTYMMIFIAKFDIVAAGGYRTTNSLVFNDDVRFKRATVPDTKINEYLRNVVLFNYIESEKDKKNSINVVPRYTPIMRGVHLIYEIIHPEQGLDGFKMINENDLYGDPEVAVGRAMLEPDGNWNVDTATMLQTMKGYIRRRAHVQAVQDVSRKKSLSVPSFSSSNSQSEQSEQSGKTATEISYAPGFGDFEFLNSGEYTMFYVLIGLLVMIIACCCLFWIMMTMYCILCGILSSGSKSNPCLLQSGDEQYV